ncbi:hypothetical protein PoB_000524800 [Plakobranchus ocellatus]|uniref:Uncharacterized protein n=1 Tax=Plakobranchus ocellatus TaxID=259542 RepID=A0AAV3Y9A7_9GAST|nr:hypothetical protein PoB_000524800 [Plakobranchus ocellatus]
MAGKDSGDAGGEAPSENQQQATRRSSQPFAITPGSGEIIITVDDALKLAEDDNEDSGQLIGEDEAILSESGHRPTLKKTPFLPISKKRIFGRRLQLVRRRRSGNSRFLNRGWSWLPKLYADTPLGPGMELLLMFLAFIGLSMLAFLVCFATTRMMLKGCGWSVCFRFHHNRGHSVLNHQAKVTHGASDGCIFRRHVPNSHFSFLEIIHDFRSRHSVLVEWRNGLRCMVFDMRRYVPPYDTCPASYPSSLDERLGVPASRSRLSLSFPRRFARHHFAPLEANHLSLKEIAGSFIGERCLMAKIYVALLVEARMENYLCIAATQFVVDEMLVASDTGYNITRSAVMSDQLSGTVVLYENWEKPAVVKSLQEAGNEKHATGADGFVGQAGEERRGQLLTNTLVSEDQAPEDITNHALDKSDVDGHHEPQLDDLDKLHLKGPLLDNIDFSAKTEIGPQLVESILARQLTGTWLESLGPFSGVRHRNLDTSISPTSAGKIANAAPNFESKSEGSQRRDPNMGDDFSRIPDSNRQMLKETGKDIGKEANYDSTELPPGEERRSEEPTATTALTDEPPVALDGMSVFVVNERRTLESHGTTPNDLHGAETGHTDQPTTGPMKAEPVTRDSQGHPSLDGVGDKLVDKEKSPKETVDHSAAVNGPKDVKFLKDTLLKKNHSEDEASIGMATVLPGKTTGSALSLSKRNADGATTGVPNATAVGAPVHPRKDLLSLIPGLVLPVDNLKEVRGQTHSLAVLLKGTQVKTEARRYFLWRGRITRVCRLRKMPQRHNK